MIDAREIVAWKLGHIEPYQRRDDSGCYPTTDFQRRNPYREVFAGDSYPMHHGVVQIRQRRGGVMEAELILTWISAEDHRQERQRREQAFPPGKQGHESERAEKGQEIEPLVVHDHRLLYCPQRVRD